MSDQCTPETARSILRASIAKVEKQRQSVASSLAAAGRGNGEALGAAIVGFVYLDCSISELIQAIGLVEALGRERTGPT